MWIDRHIVIGKGQYFSARRANRGIQCIRLSGPRLKYIPEPAGIAANEVFCHCARAVAGIVVGDEDLPSNASGHLGGSDALQRGLEETASVEGAHNDRDIHLIRYLLRGFGSISKVTSGAFSVHADSIGSTTSLEQGHPDIPVQHS